MSRFEVAAGERIRSHQGPKIDGHGPGPLVRSPGTKGILSRLGIGPRGFQLEALAGGGRVAVAWDTGMDVRRWSQAAT